MSLSGLLHLSVLLIPALTAGALGSRLTRTRACLASLASLMLAFLQIYLPQPLTLSSRSQLVAGVEVLYLDELNGWLLAYGCILYLSILMCAPRAEVSPRWFASLLTGLSLDLTFFSVRGPLALGILWILTHACLLNELTTLPDGTNKRRLVRIVWRFCGLGCLFFLAGCVALSSPHPPAWAYLCLTLGILLRKAIVPFHQWLPELFEKGPLGHVIAFCSPQLGAYATVRLLAGGASDEFLTTLGALALVTALHGACLAFGQKSFRGAYAGLFMGQTSLVFAGLQCTTHASLAGGLMVWISGGMALTGLGLCVWALLARRGGMRLDSFQGGYESSPWLATSFLIFGLASSGFPGTLGFLGQDLLLQGTTLEYPHIGALVAVVTALNGITAMRAYFHLFCGSPRQYTISQSLRPRERAALMLLLAHLIGLGIFPMHILRSRWRSAHQILTLRLEHRSSRP